MKCKTLEVVYKRILSKLRDIEGFNVVYPNGIIPINQNRYFIARGEEYAIFVMYKRDPFFNFGKQFRHLGYKGVGDSINVEDLKECLRYSVKDIYSVFPNGKAYKIDLIDFLTKGLSWTNKEGKLIKSISIHEYKEAIQI